MTDREKLIKVLMDKPYRMAEIPAGNLADHLLAHDVTVREQGRWKILGKAVIDTVAKCDNCGEEAVWRTRNKPYAICPNCGAKMEVNHETD